MLSMLACKTTSPEEKNGREEEDNNAAQRNRTDVPEVEGKVSLDEGTHALLSHIACRYQ
ncbi:MAG: hypothetical protein U0236_21620 [Nitrospira sp.]